MRLSVNGEPVELSAPVTVSALVASLGHDHEGRGVAVAVNGEVVARGAWDRTEVEDQDRIEILNAVQGG